MTLELNLEDFKQELERKHLNSRITNEYKDGNYVYLGAAVDLWMDLGWRGSISIRGNAELSKYDRSNGKIMQKKYVKLIPPRKEDFEVPVWEFCAGKYSSRFFISDGKPALDYDCEADYREGLMRQAARCNIKLYPELFDKVFEPIDKKLMEIYRSSKTGMQTILQPKPKMSRFEFSQKKMEKNLKKKLYDMKYEFKSDREGLIIYVGEAFDMYFDIKRSGKRLDIRGNAKLTKYNLNEKKLLHPILPPDWRILRPVYKEWSYKASKHFNFEYLISDGTPQTETRWSHQYRGGIYDNAKKDGLILKDEVFDYVFRPIDEQLMDIYKEAKKELKKW